MRWIRGLLLFPLDPEVSLTSSIIQKFSKNLVITSGGSEVHIPWISEVLLNDGVTQPRQEFQMSGGSIRVFIRISMVSGHLNDDFRKDRPSRNKVVTWISEQ